MCVPACLYVFHVYIAMRTGHWIWSYRYLWAVYWGAGNGTQGLCRAACELRDWSLPPVPLESLVRYFSDWYVHLDVVTLGIMIFQDCGKLQIANLCSQRNHHCSRAHGHSPKLIINLTSICFHAPIRWTSFRDGLLKTVFIFWVCIFTFTHSILLNCLLWFHKLFYCNTKWHNVLCITYKVLHLQIGAAVYST